MPTFDEAINRDGAEALIPEEDAREIIQGLPAASTALTLMRSVGMSSKTQRTPVLSALPQAYWVGGDTGLKQTTKQEWENQFLTAEELAVIVPVPEAVLADAEFDIWGEVRPRLIEALGDKLDQATLFGVDSPPSFPDSVVEGAVAASHVVDPAGDGDIADHVGAEGGVMNLVEESGFAVTGFTARTGIKARLRGLRDDVGQPIYQASLQAGTPAQLYDTQIVYADQNGSWNDQGVDLIGGDWSKAIIGLRQDITWKVLDQAVISDDNGVIILNLAQQDSVALRVTLRVGYATANPINRKVPDEESRYPFAVLGPLGS